MIPFRNIITNTSISNFNCVDKTVGISSPPLSFRMKYITNILPFLNLNRGEKIGKTDPTRNEMLVLLESSLVCVRYKFTTPSTLGIASRSSRPQPDPQGARTVACYNTAVYNQTYHISNKLYIFGKKLSLFAELRKVKKCPHVDVNCPQ